MGERRCRLGVVGGRRVCGGGMMFRLLVLVGAFWL